MTTEESRKNWSHCSEPTSSTCPEYGIHVYCGAGDWSTHETICKELELEKAMFRTADTLQKAYFALREPLFEKFIVKIEPRVNELVLHQERPDLVKKHGWFVDFPNDLIENENIKKAVLCFLMSREPLAYLCDLIHYLTDGRVSHVPQLD
jgi:hypothetical protein